MKKIYFPGLNGVRFIAVLLVIIDHTELFKSYFGYKTLWGNSFSIYLGSFGVTIFFVLSGFLITYLLLTEQKSSSINIKHFYFRRVLRIWPLYYLIVLICFFIVPHIDFLSVPNYSSDMNDYLSRLILFSGLLANVAFVYLPTVAFANILWSVAVEEQFYLIWPHIIKIKKNLFSIMISLLILYLTIKLIVGFLGYYILYEFITRTRFSSMIIGGLGAYLVFNEKHIVKHIYNRIIQLGMIITLFILIIDLIQFKYFNIIRNEFTSLVICGLIINIATNKHSILKLESKMLNYFGKISFGLYVYHLFAVVITLKILPNFLHLNNISNIIGYPLTIGSILLITTLISHFSYFYFEKRFLVKKANFSTISIDED